MDASYLKFCRTLRQREILETYLGDGDCNLIKTAKALNTTPNAVNKALGRLRRHAESKGYSPPHDMMQSAPETHRNKGYSQYYRVTKEGDHILTNYWVKTERDGDAWQAYLEEMQKAIIAELPQFDPITPASAGELSKDLMAVYPMGDPHLGMLSWAEEAEADFNLDICVRNLCRAVDYLANLAPPCEEALLINLGDFFHADSGASRSKSGNILDTSDVHSRVIHLGIACMRQAIESLLRRHGRVTVIIAIGNHDELSALWLMTALKHIYDNEPRVNIVAEPRLKHYVHFGECLFGIHHGHAIKKEALPMQMASDCQYDYWHKSCHRAWFTGHIHSETVREDAHSGVMVKSYRTLAPKDKWHTDMGYKSARDMDVELWHRTNGLVSTHKVSVNMLTEDD